MMVKTNSSEKLLHRVSEAAEILSMSRAKAYLMAQSGEIPAIRIGKCIRIPAEALREWVAQRASETHAA